MRPEELSLLLSVARLLRAQMRDQLAGGVLQFNAEADLRDLDEALAPFDPLPAVEGGEMAAAQLGAGT